VPAPAERNLAGLTAAADHSVYLAESLGWGAWSGGAFPEPEWAGRIRRYRQDLGWTTLAGDLLDLAELPEEEGKARPPAVDGPGREARFAAIRGLALDEARQRLYVLEQAGGTAGQSGRFRLRCLDLASGTVASVPTARPLELDPEGTWGARFRFHHGELLVLDRPRAGQGRRTRLQAVAVATGAVRVVHLDPPGCGRLKEGACGAEAGGFPVGLGPGWVFDVDDHGRIGFLQGWAVGQLVPDPGAGPAPERDTASKADRKG
jgi:hypothetical protein